MNRCELEDPHQHELVNRIFGGLVSKYKIEDLMKLVKENRDCTVYIALTRDNPMDVDIVIDREGKYSYCCGDVLMIPIPKKFAVLEPDKKYFEMTLKANIFLAVMRADERELHT